MSQENLNYENRFQVVFSNETYKELTKSIVNITTPDISIGATIQPTAIRNIYVPGDSVELGDITLTHLLDEDYWNYKTYFEWLNVLRNLDSIDLSREVIDISIVLLDNKHYPFLSIDIQDAFPFVLSEIPLDYQIAEIEPIRFSVTYKINGVIIR